MILVNAVLIIALVALDQWVKYWVTANIHLGTDQVLIPGIMNVTNLHNYGAAWSMLQGKQTFFSIITIVVIVAILYCMWKFRKQRGKMLCFSLILAGAIGNFIDRLSQGYVVDMFEFAPVNFPVFNVADMCLTFGVLILIIIILREDEEK